MNSEKRTDSIDAVAGLLIIYMIYKHIVQWLCMCDDSVYVVSQQILFFFMAWFAFKAGMFFRVKDYRPMLIDSFRRLIVPFVIYSFCGWILWSIDRLLDGDVSLRTYFRTPARELWHLGAIGGNLPLWWLSSLFLARLIFNAILRQQKVVATLLISFLVLLPLLLNFGFGRTTDHLYLANVPTLLLFLMSGYWLKQWTANRYLLILSFFVYVLSVIFIPSYVDFRTGQLVFGSFPVWVLSSLAGILLINAAFAAIPFRMSVLTYVGRHSIIFFAVHWLVLYACKIVCRLI